MRQILHEALKRHLPERCTVDGEIVVVTDRRLDFFALQQRVHPAASRVDRLAAETPASFIAFDLMRLGDDDLLSTPFRDRRAALERLLEHAPPPLHLTPLTSDEHLAREWFERFEGAGLDGIIAKPLDGTYVPDKRTMFKVKHERTADCVVAGYRVHKTDPEAIGSLLLGLYGEDGSLASIGVIGAFPMADRKRLYQELQELVTTFDGHPWNWAAFAESVKETQWQGGSRWNAGKDLSFIPLRPERVVEARYDYMEGNRFRHTAQFVRWRPDRTPLSCTFDQLERPVTTEISSILPGLDTK